MHNYEAKPNLRLILLQNSAVNLSLAYFQELKQALSELALDQPIIQKIKQIFKKEIYLGGGQYLVCY